MNETAETMKILCPQCNNPVDTDARFCKFCAFDLTNSKANLDSDSTIGVNQSASRSNFPIIFGGITLIVIIFIALAFYFTSGSRTNSSNANSVSSNSSVITLSTKAQQVEEKILRGQALVSNDIAGLSTEELRILRNVHFARYGRKYERPGLGDYFYTRSWYKPSDNFNDSMITAKDKSNIDLILKSEKGENKSEEVASVTNSQEEGEGEDLGDSEEEYTGNSPEQEAIAEVKKFWEQHSTKCGDSYYSAGGDYESGYTYQYRNVAFTPYQNSPLTEADKLNGILWKGSVAIRPETYRKSYSNQWQQWEQLPPRNPGNVITATKRNSGWQVLQLFDITKNGKINCSDVPK